jgi:ribose transport system ATP-binding protein
VGGRGLTPAVRLRHISKSFGGVRALDGAHLEVLRGEVHGLLGENGSGKSTLIKILAGYHDPEPCGELHVDGHAARLPLRPGEARTLGLAFVHQDLGLIPSLSVVENLRLTEFAVRRGWRISWNGERRRAAEALARYGVTIDPRAVVGELRPLDRALLAIVRAMEDLGAGGVLVLDEPTAFLPSAEAERLFALVRSIAEAGTSVVFVSHDLDEARRITDRVTVLRDGRTVGTVVSAETATEEFATMILGGRLAARPPACGASGAAEGFVLVARLRGETLEDVSFDVGHGEVLGVTGLAGSGFEELPYFLFGARRAAAGTLELAGASYDLTRMTPAAALGAGIVLVPSDRARDGAVGSLSLAENLMLPALDRYRAGPCLERRRLVVAAGELLRRFDVRPSDPHMPYESLSGGNQQKALLAKWLQSRPSLLLLDEPTRGVDVGARPHIWALIRAAADDGAAVICASSDSEELATLCDRILST